MISLLDMDEEIVLLIIPFKLEYIQSLMTLI